MGRVSKYKKVKSVNLLGKGTASGAVWGFGDNGCKPKKRSATALALRKKKLKRKRETGVVEDDGFNLPPQGGDEFDLSDLTVKKQKPKPLEEGLVDRNATTVTGQRYVVPETERETAKVARLLKIDQEKTKESITEKSRGRMEGESKNAFNRRVKNETRQIIMRETKDRQNTAKRQRKKEFLNKKKKKNKKGTVHEDDSDYGGTPEDGSFDDKFVTGEMAAAAASRVAFGEQAERPPVFQQLPRGAEERATKISTKKASSKSMSDSQIEAEHNAMEAMRRKVQAQYALIKAKRKKAGDFHL